MTTRKLAPPPASAPPQPALHRSGAVARMLHMPVATLRVWERRYGLTQPAQTPGSQRLYSADDVQRLSWLKRLTDLGHAIGSLAPLDLAQLQRVAATHAQALAATRPDERADAAATPPARAWRLAVIGAALGARLQRPALLRRLVQPVVLLGPFDNAAALQAANVDVDAVLLHAPQLQPGFLEAIDEAAPSLAGLPKAVLYGFAAEPLCEALATAGTALLRAPQPDVVLAQWLNSLSSATTAPRPVARSGATSEPIPPRRWDDAALVDFASLSSSVACECPSHVAEVLMQLSHFEAYSAECEQLSTADAELHAYLRRVAATARAHFESALEQVAMHEGLLLPMSPRHESPNPEAAMPSKALNVGVEANLSHLPIE